MKINPPFIDVRCRPVRRGGLLALFAACLAGTGMASAAPRMVELTLSHHEFTPDHVTVPAGTRFSIRVTNHDSTPDEFESPALRVERIVMPRQTITVHAGPLTPGTYKFYDDYHPETAHGIVEAK